MTLVTTQTLDLLVDAALLSSMGDASLFFDPAGHPISHEQMGMLKWGTKPRVDLVGRTFHGPLEISTVWLGIDHGHGHGPPLIFETMIFGPDVCELAARYSTWEDAAAGHASLVGWLRVRAPIRTLPAGS